VEVEVQAQQPQQRFIMKEHLVATAGSDIILRLISISNGSYGNIEIATGA